jgi:mRNA interferase MazF
MAKRIDHPRRGEVWLVNFDPALGSEIQKTRPALVIQNDIGNRVSDVTIVGAITSTVKRSYPFQVHLPAGEGGVSTDCFVTLNQIRSVDRRRLARRLGAVSEATMKAVDQAIVISLGIDIGNIE